VDDNKKGISMNAKIVQVKGITLIGKTDSGHWIPMDGPVDLNGQDAAIRPKELLLVGLGGCTGMDVVSILQKMKEKVTRFEIDIDAQSANEHPKVFTKIHIIYKFWGENLNESNINKAITLSQERYCSVSAMLKKSLPLTHSYEINPDLIS
jgi:putative redox protein